MAGVHKPRPQGEANCIERILYRFVQGRDLLIDVAGWLTFVSRHQPCVS